MEESREMNNYRGWQRWKPTASELADFYTYNTCPLNLKENEYLIIVDENTNEDVGFYKKVDDKIVQIKHASFKSKSQSGKEKVINPRNSEQKCACDLLVDDRTTVKLITGTWGAGKTIFLVTAGLQALREHRFDRIVWIRNNIDVKDTKDLGALPGDIYEKLLPFLGPFVDHGGGEEAIKTLVDKKLLIVEPLQYLRGRNLERTLIMCSESENLTAEHLKLIIARCAEGTELWLDGDIVQRDRKVFEDSKGIERMINSLAGNELFGYVDLVKVERSKTASLADKIK